LKIFVINIAILFAFTNVSNAFEFGDSVFANKDSDNISAPEIYVSQIIIGGNNKTDEDIITREMDSKEYSKLDYKVLEEDIARIYKLGLFNRVDVIPIPTDSLHKVNLMILVEERFYILPIPQGGFRNGNFSNFWAGMNLIINNFRGRNEAVSLSFGLGYEPFVNLSYSVPWIGEKAHFFSSTSLSYSNNYNRSIQTLNDTSSSISPEDINNYTNYNFNAAYNIGKYFTNNFSIVTGLKYNIVHLSKYEEGRTVSASGQDNFLTFSLGGRFDTRNSNEYTTAGSLYTLEYIKFGFGRLFDFNKINLDARRFIPIKLGSKYSISLATRVNGVLSFGGEIPIYLNEFYGFDKIIRGYKNIVLEAENQLGFFNEIRIPIIDPFYIKGKSIPLAKGISMLKNLNYKFGLFATVFFDAGGVWNKNDNFFETRFYNGFGAGLNFLLPFGFVGRTDFAFRKDNKKFIPQVIFDLNSTF